jgi:hypothetical protein
MNFSRPSGRSVSTVRFVNFAIVRQSPELLLVFFRGSPAEAPEGKYRKFRSYLNNDYPPGAYEKASDL